MARVTGPAGLRVVAFSVFPAGYRQITEWAAAGGHKLVLVVTTPGPSTRRNTTTRRTAT